MVVTNCGETWIPYLTIYFNKSTGSGFHPRSKASESGPEGSFCPTPSLQAQNHPPYNKGMHCRDCVGNGTGGSWEPQGLAEMPFLTGDGHSRHPKSRLSFPPIHVCQLWALAEEQVLSKANNYLWRQKKQAELWHSSRVRPQEPS